MNTDQLIIMLQKQFKGTSIAIMKSWVKDIFTLNTIVEFSLIATRSVSKAEHGGPKWKYTQARLLKKKKEALSIILFILCLCWIYISWVNPYTNCIFVTSHELLVSITLKSHISLLDTTDEVRMNTKIKQILNKYEACWLFIWASSG